MTDNELDYRTVSQCISSDYCRGWNEAVAEAIDLINRQKAEIEHLKVTTIIGEVREIPMEHKTLALVSWEHTLVKAVKAEAIEEFADRLKEKIGIGTTWDWVFEDIDEVVEEMIGDQKNERQ